jgi:ABC-type transport system involved in Fe-S cluster assembly fused permease/ATPase subunit
VAYGNPSLNDATILTRCSHAQLLALDGQYARMWALQQAGE